MNYTRSTALRAVLDSMNDYDTPVEEIVETYIIFAGDKEGNLKPVDATETKAYARQVAKDVAEAYPYVEVIYMPDDFTADVVAIYKHGKKLK